MADMIGLLVAQTGMHGNGTSSWWMGGMMLWMPILWVALIWGAVWAARAALAPRERRSNRALEILDERLAQGTISDEEYAERRAVITGLKVSSPKLET